MPINPDRLRTGGAFNAMRAADNAFQDAKLRELEPGERVGVFKIVKELSRGGMAVVYLATRADGEFEQRVALKWMGGARDLDAAAMLFKRERDILASLEHPGIARLIDGGHSDDGMLWFAMELIEGETIDRWCVQQNLSLRARLELIFELIDALSFAHARLLIHRDIKPSNVLVSRDGRAKLLDFGIASLADRKDGQGNFAMTPGYASPEQWLGEEVTVASDVYQVGLLLAVILANLHPANSDSHLTRNAFDAINHSQPSALSASQLGKLPLELAAIILHATALQPTDRYATSLAIKEDLQRFLLRHPVHAWKGGFWYPTWCLLRRHPISSTVFVAAMMGLIGLGLQLMQQRNLAEQEAMRANTEATRANAEADRAKSALEFMFSMLEWSTPEGGRGESVSVETALARGVTQLRDSLKDQTQLRAELLAQFGTFYARKRQPEKAIPLLEEAYSLQTQIPNLDAFVHADTGTRLGNILSNTDPVRSRSLYTASIQAMQNRNDAAAATLRIASKRFLAGSWYQVEGDLERAHSIILDAQRDAKKWLSDRDSEQVSVQRELATYLNARGDFVSSLELQIRLLDQARRNKGEDHPVVVQLSERVSSTLIALGRFSEAMNEITRVEPILRKTWGEKDAENVRYLNQMLLIHLANNRITEARQLSFKSLALVEAGGLRGELYLARQYAYQGKIELASREFAQAENWFRKSLRNDIRARSSWRDFGYTELELAQALREQKKFNQIANVLVASEKQLRSLPELHLTRSKLDMERALLVAHQGDRLRAKSMLLHALKIAQNSPAQHAREKLLVEIEFQLGHI